MIRISNIEKEKMDIAKALIPEFCPEAECRYPAADPFYNTDYFTLYAPDDRKEEGMNVLRAIVCIGGYYNVFLRKHGIKNYFNRSICDKLTPEENRALHGDIFEITDQMIDEIKEYFEKDDPFLSPMNRYEASLDPDYRKKEEIRKRKREDALLNELQGGTDGIYELDL